MMAKGGASLAPLHGNAEVIPAATLEAMNARLDQIHWGLYRVEINESPPANYLTPHLRCSRADLRKAQKLSMLCPTGFLQPKEDICGGR